MTQFEFPFPAWAEREDLLRACEFPTGLGCYPGTLKAVLSEIARFPECWETQITIAKNTGYSRATIQRAIIALSSVDLITTERRWCHVASQVRNFHRVNWEALRRMNERIRHLQKPQHNAEHYRPKPHPEADQSLTASRPKPHPEADQSLTLRHKQQEQLQDTTTTTEEVVVVLRTLAKGKRAIRLARARGLTDEAICELYRLWRALPEDQRLRGTLFNWLAIEGSYRAPAPPQPTCTAGRSDGLSRSQVAAESLRLRIVRAGRAAGASQEAIEQRLQACGV